MPDFFYKFTITGTDMLDNPEVELEGNAISVVSTDGGKTWRNKGKSVKIAVSGQLQFKMTCGAPGKVDYVFEISNSDGNGKVNCPVFKEGGFTGDTGTGFSRKQGSVDPDC